MPKPYLFNLLNACKRGDVNEVDNIISTCKNPNWNWGLYGACEGGHLDLVIRMVDYGACEFNEAAIIAINNKHIDIFEYLLGKGVTNVATLFDYSNNEKVINLLNEYCKNNNVITIESLEAYNDNNRAALEAINYNNFEIFKYFFDKGITNMGVCYYKVMYTRDKRIKKLIESKFTNEEFRMWQRNN